MTIRGLEFCHYITSPCIAFVNITQQPMSTAQLVGETASFSCEASSRPPPIITWFRVESGSALMLVDDGMNIRITSEVAGNTTSSSLSVLVQGAEELIQYFCVADNGFDNQTSDRVDLVQAGMYEIYNVNFQSSNIFFFLQFQCSRV